MLGSFFLYNTQWSKNNSIDFNLYQADVNAINIVEDYYKLLEGIGKQEFAFSSERKPPKKADVEG